MKKLNNMNVEKKQIARAVQGLVLAMMAGAVMAQVAPDAGLLLQENAPVPQMPAEAPALPGSSAPAQSEQVAAGGTQVVLQSVQMDQVPGIDQATLLKATGLSDVTGKEYDLAGLKGLADNVTAYLHAQGLSFARVWLPEQDLQGGVLKIRILPGQYGQVQAIGDDTDIVAHAQQWLAPLQSGEVIHQDTLHRSLLLLSDLPGVQTVGTLRPGSAQGEADLAVDVQKQRSLRAYVGADNHGNRYAGRNRVLAGIEGSPGLVFGDYLGFNALRTSIGTWQAGLSYSLPLGHNGWQLQGQLSRSDYQLGNDFASLGAYGTADTAMATLSYSLVRSQKTNVKLAAGLVWRGLEDVRDSVGSRDSKHTRGTQVSLSANHRDNTGVTWGVLGWHMGELSLGATQRQDDLTARSSGTYHKLTLDLGRLQRLGSEFSLYARVSSQWADKNLDSSEKFVLGGVSGVRAWPAGEGNGDTGVLGQLELRYQLGNWQPYAFVDAGMVKVNRKPWSVVNNRYMIAGKGLGARYTGQGVQLDVAVAHRNGSAPSQSEPNADKTRVWARATYQF